jgi:hypothetical protein
MAADLGYDPGGLLMGGPMLSSDKAKKILKDGEVRGNPLTKKQKGFFGARAGGSPMPTYGKAKRAIQKKAKRDAV